MQAMGCNRTVEVGQFVRAVRNLDREQPERVVQLLRRTFVELVHKLVAANGFSIGTTEMLASGLEPGRQAMGDRHLRLNTPRGQNDGMRKSRSLTRMPAISSGRRCSWCAA